jgi:alanine dehydrogenase
MRQPFLVLTASEVRSLVSLPDAIAAVEAALRDFAEGKAFLFPVIRERIDPYGGFFGVKAGYLASRGCLGYKGGGFWAANRNQGLAGHQSLILLYDPASGVPRAAMDGNYVTILRTGAIGAIAARFLARADSRTVAILGAGAQGRIQLAALREVLSVEEVRCFDVDSEANEAFARLAGEQGLRAEACANPRQAVEGADVVVTASPSFQPIVEDAWVRPGMHLSAFGADTKGKQEIEARVLARAKVVVDYLPQAREIGECQHAFRTGLIEGVHAELGEILVGRKPGRESGAEITLFDATGIALQDLAVARLAYEAALQRGLGVRLELD